MGLIDSHTHLDAFSRRGELGAILKRARAAGVDAMIASGTEPEDWRLYQRIAGEHSGIVHYTVGLHPCSVGEDWEAAIAGMGTFIRPAGARDAGEGEAGADRMIRAVAIGEIGLDRYHLPKESGDAGRIFARQQAAFAAQLKLAVGAGLPVVVHSRGAFHECVEAIDASGLGWGRVVFHCFSEGVAEMNVLMERGGRGSFTGIITYKNAEGVREAAKVQGLDRLMIETDAPYLAPMPHRGKPNEPAFVRHTAEACATLFGVSYERVAVSTAANTRRFYGLPEQAPAPEA